MILRKYILKELKGIRKKVESVVENGREAQLPHLYDRIDHLIELLE